MTDSKLVGSSLTGGKRKKGNGHKPTCGCPICKNMKKGGSNPQSSDDVDIPEVAKPGVAVQEDINPGVAPSAGGSRRRRRRSSKRKTRKKTKRRRR